MTQIESLFEKDFDFIIKRTHPLKGLKAPAHDPQPRDYQVAKIFLPIILASKWMGYCPVTISRDHRKKDTLKYHFKWVSLPLLATLVLYLANAMLMLLYTLNSYLNIDKPFRVFKRIGQQNWLSESLFKGSEVVGILNNLFRISLPLGASFCCLFSWMDVGSLCQYFDNWPLFIQKFHLNFSPHYTLDFKCLRKSRNFSLLLWISPVLFLLWAIKPVNYLLVDSPFLTFIFAHYQTLNILGSRSLSYVKDFLLLQSLQTAYVQLGKGINNEYSRYQTNISAEQVRQWWQLLIIIRKQTKRVESHISLQNLWSIFEVFASVLMLLSMSVFLAMNGALTGVAGSNFLPLGIICSSFFVSSVYWKTELADRITKAEEDIADHVIRMETDDEDIEARLEMKQICDLIYDDPIRIEVGQMLTLNRRLLLAYFSQLATYLVVILQYTNT